MRARDKRASGTAQAAPQRHLPAAEPADHRLPVLGLLCGGGGDRQALRSRRHGGVRGHDLRHPRRAHRAPDAHRERLRQGVRQPRGHGGLRSRARDRRVPVGRGAHHGVRAATGGVSAGWRASSTPRRRRCAWRASMRARPPPTSATSRACRALPRRRSWPPSSGSAATGASRASPGSSPPSWSPRAPAPSWSRASAIRASSSSISTGASASSTCCSCHSPSS